MESEIQKAVESGKLTSQAGAVLEQLKPGSYCMHKSWGFGRIADLNFLLNQITIDFKHKKAHTMQLQYAGDSLKPIGAEHILARKKTGLAAVQAQAKEDPVGFFRAILKDLDGRATQDQLAQLLVGDVFTEAEFKRWWESTKKALKKDGHFAVPSKRSEPVELRDQAVSRSDELLAAFANVRQLKDLLAALDQINKNLDAFSDPAKQIAPVMTAAENTARKSQRLHSTQALELILARDEIGEKIGRNPAENRLTLAQILREEERRLTDILQSVPAAKQKRIFAEFPNAFGESWSSKALSLMLRSNVRVVAELARLLQEKGRHDELRHELDRWISDHSITTEILHWLCKDRQGDFADLIHPRVFSAIIAALERAQFSESSRGGKLHDLMLEDRELLGDILGSAEPEIARDSMRKLMLTPVFEELNKRSLIGRIIKIHPELQSMLTSDPTEKQEALIVSWESLEKRKNEYEELITKKIPENTKEISIARSYGDLRENFEFKAAKEMQRVLMRRKAETEQALSRARGTNFENPDATQVSIGTVVTLKNLEDGASEIYSILGAWDSDPDRGIISYLAAIGQALLGHKPSEIVELPSEGIARKVEIVSIEPYRSATVAA
jgi:transcription elongation GreA/GreB family factor